MELGLSLGEASAVAASTSRPPFGFVETNHHNKSKNDKGLGFCMGLGVVGFTNNGRSRSPSSSEDKTHEEPVNRNRSKSQEDQEKVVVLERRVSPPLQQLDLLPLHPVPRNNPPGLNWPPSSDYGNSGEVGSSGHLGLSSGAAAAARGFDVNQLPSADEGDDGATVSSPNSTVSSFQIDFSIYSGGGGGTGSNKRDAEALGLNDAEAERASSRASDEEENGLTRKKLRLSKEQSAFLEESFKEHNTLNPKQKLALAKQLNLRPRQVEVWFQNRRARTKLKQTEVDCEYLKRCCETLTDENRRLQKELQELRALKTSHPYYMQLPATTLTMCPSCERVATTTTTATAAGTTATATATTTTTVNTTTTTATKANSTSTAFSFNKARFYPFSQQPHLHHQSAAS